MIGTFFLTDISFVVTFAVQHFFASGFHPKLAEIPEKIFYRDKRWRKWKKPRETRSLIRPEKGRVSKYVHVWVEWRVRCSGDVGDENLNGLSQQETTAFAGVKRYWVVVKGLERNLSHCMKDQCSFILYWKMNPYFLPREFCVPVSIWMEPPFLFHGRLVWWGCVWNIGACGLPLP